jgi:S1-C subfamily serine protease
MDNYDYENYNRPPKRKGGMSYLLVALIGAIIGGLITSYIAPNYLYGKVIPLPDIYNTGGGNLQKITINPNDDYTAVTAVAKKSMSSVVGITTVQVQRDFIWEREVEGVGSGVIIDKDGYILTNSHVIGDGKAKRINVLFENGDKAEGEVLWFDPTIDLAVVKTNSRGLNAADLGNSDDLVVGELSVAIGNPLGLDFQRTVTSGVISGLHRSIRIDQYNIIEDLIQTDASINPGNSGGPLLNNKGEVIGINTAKVQTGEGLGFAIPINLAKPIVEEVIQKGDFTNVTIGIKPAEVELVERQLGIELSPDTGIVVVEVTPNSPAQKSGLKAMDVITKIDNTKLDTVASLRKILYNYKEGDKAILTVNRDGKNMELEIEF